jgi:hypothetical protein
MNKAVTLDKFFESSYPDGHYAVWKTGKILNPSQDGFLYGFSGAVVEYNNCEGFKDYPEWMDNTDDQQINIVLLSEIPMAHELSTGEF